MAKNTPTTEPVDDADLVEEAKQTSDDGVLEITVGDATFRVPRRRGQWATKVHLAFARGQNAHALELLLGPDQWATAEEIPWSDFNDLLEAIRVDCTDD